MLVKSCNLALHKRFTLKSTKVLKGGLFNNDLNAFAGRLSQTCDFIGGLGYSPICWLLTFLSFI